jgi:predicted nucleic acid-binding protein
MSDVLALVDTSMWIEAWRHTGDPAARECVLRWYDDDLAAVCYPVVLELIGGARTPAEVASIQAHFTHLPFLSVNNRVWEAAGEYAFTLLRKGLTIPTMDVLIATTAAVHEVPLLHRDEHYRLCAGVIPFRDISPDF